MTRRLDLELVERGLAPTRSKAQALIMAGDIRIGDRPALKAGEPVEESDSISIAEKNRFVSRGGDKLERGLSEFQIELEGAICADVGASTGGFTDALLQRGAARIYAIDVGYGQIALELRNDPRVVVMDRTNARYLESLPEPIDFTTVDASFISLSKIMPAVVRISQPGASMVALIKPQFEAGKGEVGKNGVVRDNAIHERILHNVIESANENGFALTGLIASPLKGPAGNIEFLGYFRLGLTGLELVDPGRTVSEAIAGAPS